jgi:hypothetical protein
MLGCWILTKPNRIRIDQQLSKMIMEFSAICTAGGLYNDYYSLTGSVRHTGVHPVLASEILEETWKVRSSPESRSVWDLSSPSSPSLSPMSGSDRRSNEEASILPTQLSAIFHERLKRTVRTKMGDK